MSDGGWGEARALSGISQGEMARRIDALLGIINNTIEHDGATWVSVNIMPTTIVYARVPDGDTVEGLGRRWEAKDQPQMVLPRQVTEQ